jgi:hypothetical protein
MRLVTASLERRNGAMASELLDVQNELLVGSTETLQRALLRSASQALSERDAKDLLRHSRYVLSRITGVYRRSRKALASGIEGALFSQVCDHMKEVIEKYLTGNRVLEKAILQQQPSARQNRRLVSLKDINEEADRILQIFQSWSMAFGRSPRAIDWDAVAEVEAAHTRGEHRRADEFEAHLEKRGGQ